MRLMMSKSKSVARKIIVPSGQLSAGGHTCGRTSQISSTSSWPTMQRRASRSGGCAVRGEKTHFRDRADRVEAGGCYVSALPQDTSP